MADVSSRTNPPRQQSAPRAPRRAVRLQGDEHSAIAEVLREYKDVDVSGKRLHEDVRQFAETHRGELIAAEWLSPLGWTRFLWCRR